MKDLSLYIHIPFCKTICLYCNFLTFANKNKKIPDYIQALQHEIEGKAGTYKEYRIETIYFGGGTPSLIDTIYIGEILKIVQNNFQIAPNPEITLECNPESTNEIRIKDWMNAGITRFSLGIQSFNPKTLLRIARPHNGEAILKALGSFKKTGADNIGADFIMGLPFQTVESFQKELEQILTFQPQHLSYYFLSYDTKRIDIFKADCPPEEDEVAMYHHLTGRLAEEGYRHYEVSNYAKPGFESRHNLRYWNQQEYLGVGLGAHSYISHKSWENECNFEQYLINPFGIQEEVPIDAELDRLEYIMLHLRTQRGIDLHDYEQRFDKTAELLEKASQHIDEKELTHTKNMLQPTDKGFLFIDRITRNLL